MLNQLICNHLRRTYSPNSIRYEGTNDSFVLTFRSDREEPNDKRHLKALDNGFSVKRDLENPLSFLVFHAEKEKEAILFEILECLEEILE